MLRINDYSKSFNFFFVCFTNQFLCKQLSISTLQIKIDEDTLYTNIITCCASTLFYASKYGSRCEEERERETISYQSLREQGHKLSKFVGCWPSWYTKLLVREASCLIWKIANRITTTSWNQYNSISWNHKDFL